MLKTLQNMENIHLQTTSEKLKESIKNESLKSVALSLFSTTTTL